MAFPFRLSKKKNAAGNDATAEAADKKADKGMSPKAAAADEAQEVKAAKIAAKKKKRMK